MINESLIDELSNEAGATRRVLERVPEAKMSWKPHPKSYSLGQLAHHVAVLPGQIADLVTTLSPPIPNAGRPEAESVAQLLSLLQSSVAHATEKLRTWNDDALKQTWKLMNDGQVLIQSSRIGVIRAIMLNHWYHHRGQLMVYLRLLDVPVPAVYGPSADESRFGR